MFRVFIISLLVLIALCNTMQGQGNEYNYTQYTVADGLPTNYVYGVVEDDDGYIWAYTENGLSKFDGYKFENFSTLNGLGGNDIVRLMKDSLGVMYAHSFNNIVTCLKDDSLSVVKHEQDSLFTFTNVYDGLLFSSNDTIFELLDGEAIAKLEVYNIDSILYRGYISESFPFSALVMNNNKGNKLFNVDTLNGEFLANEVQLPTEVLNTFDLNLKPFYLEEHNLSVIFNSKVIILRNAIKNITKYFFWNDIFKDNPKDVILSVNYDGSYFLDTSLGTIEVTKDLELVNDFIPQNIIDKFSVLRYYKDSKGNYWIGTNEGGLFLVSAREVQTKTFKAKETKDNIFKRVIKNNTSVLGVTDKLALYDLEKYSLTKKRILKESKYYNVSILDDKNALINSRDKMCVLDLTNFDMVTLENHLNLNFEHYQIDSTYLLGRIFINSREVILTSSNSYIYVANSNCLLLIDNEKEVISIVSDKNISNLYKSHYNEVLYCSSFENLYSLQYDQLESIVTMPDEVCVIKPFSKDSLLVGTINSGLYFVDLDTKKYSLVSTENSIRKIEKFNDYYYMASNNGLSVVEYMEGSFKERYNFNEKDGLPSSIVHDFLIQEEEIVLATNSGLVIVENAIPELVISIDDPAFITEVSLSDSLLALSESLVFSSENNDLSASFKLLNYESKGNITYDYQLEPLDSAWNSTKELEFKYYDLKPDDYILKLKATDAFGNTYLSSNNYNFSIKQAFWKSPIFFISMFVLGCLLVFLLVKKREKFYDERIRKEKAINSKIAELQMESLRSQMNPHFIFNALGSIQYYIQTHKVDEADKYLTKFAHLMRQYLESATENMILLENEITLLKDYLDLEAMRFENLFQYKIKVADNVDIQRIQIPSMLLQPYVENAINHGLQLRKDGNGKLSVDFSLDSSGVLKCVIIDNGIGTHNAKKYNSKMHKSRGMSNIKKRVEVLKSTDVCDLNIDISSGFEDENYPGTKITIEFENLNEKL